MAFIPGSIAGKVTSSKETTSSGFVPGSIAGTRKSYDLNTVEGLADKAKSMGLEDEVNSILDSTPRLSVIQRLGKGLGAFNPAEAILTGTEKGVTSGAGKYIEGIAQGVGSAITGKDYEGERRTFADVAQKLGVKNSIAKFGIGVLGDIFLDPSTYFGGAIAKGVTKGIGSGAKLATNVLGKVSPKAAQGVELFTEGIKETTGKAFKYGYGTSKGLSEKALEIQSRLAKTKEGIVTSNINRLGTGTLAPSQQEELVNKLLAGKRGELELSKGIEQSSLDELNVLAPRKAANTLLKEAIKTGDFSKIAPDVAEQFSKSADPLVQSTITEQSTRSQKFAKQAGINDPYEVYFPGLKNDSVKNFIEGTRNLRVGSQGYLKEFKNLLTDEQLIKNPAEAFAKQEFNIAKDNIIKSELNSIVKEFGKPLTAFNSEEDALKAGYKVIKDKGIFGKAVGYILENDHKFISNLISPEFTTIDALAKATGFDALTSLFKRSVTGLFAPFHIRNYVSGMVQNFEVLGHDALSPKVITSAQKIAYKLSRGESFGNQVINVTGKPTSMTKVMNAFERRFGNSSSYISDIADATKESIPVSSSKLGLDKESLIKAVKTVGLSQEGTPFKIARTVGNFIETQQKVAAYITALGQNKSIPEALDLATRAGFDYRALTPFESKVLKRIIPFYSFTRKNIELQLRTLGENPQRINQILSTIKNIGEEPTQEEKKALPNYIKENLSIKLKDNPDGTKNFIYGFGTPIEQFGSLFRGSSASTLQKRIEGFVLGQISSMNPYLKVPTELGIGKDSFRQKDLKDVYDAKEYSKAPKIIKDLLDIKEVKKPILTRNSQGKLVKTGERTQYVADPTKLLIARSLFTARGVSYLDQVFDGDLRGLAKVIKLTTGIKPQNIDMTTSEALQERDKKRELQDLLLKMGGVSQYSRVYEPKR